MQNEKSDRVDNLDFTELGRKISEKIFSGMCHIQIIFEEKNEFSTSHTHYIPSQGI